MVILRVVLRLCVGIIFLLMTFLCGDFMYRLYRDVKAIRHGIRCEGICTGRIRHGRTSYLKVAWTYNGIDHEAEMDVMMLTRKFPRKVTVYVLHGYRCLGGDSVVSDIFWIALYINVLLLVYRFFFL